MKKVRLFVGLVTVALLAFGVLAQAGNQDFTLVNETGITIEELYISPAKADNWQEDVLGDEALPDGGSVEVGFPVDDNHCRWDLKIIDGDKDEVVWNNLDLCKISKITLFWENGNARATLE